jgi:hypothetical protein
VNATDQQPEASGWFVNKLTGALGQITAVDDSYAYLNIVSPRPSRYAIPIAEYDSTWINAWRPATAADLPADSPPLFRPPRNTGVPPEYSMVPPDDD